MKKIIYFILSIISLLNLASCSEEDGHYNHNDIGDITIGGFEKSYRLLTAVGSAEGDTLRIVPDIQSNYSESELEYYWYLIDKSKENEYNKELTDEERYKAELISRDRNLAYAVNLSLGQYNVVLKVVSKKNGYANFVITPMTVLSKFSTGFYILKEKSDGNTGLDLLKWNKKRGEDEFTGDVLDLQGVAINGVPRSLSTVYGQPYRVDNIQKGANALCITTETNDLKILDVGDLNIIKDLSGSFYDAIDEDFEPYLITSGAFSIFIFASDGVSSYYGYDGSSAINVGKFPTRQGGGASKYVVSDGWYSYYWNNTKHSIKSVDYNGQTGLIGGAIIPTSKLGELPDNLKIQIGGVLRYRSEGLVDMTCVAIGTSTAGGEQRVYLILEDSNKERYLYIIGHSNSDNEIVILDVILLAKNLNLSQSNIISTNGLDSYRMYCVNNNKLYSHSLDYSGLEGSVREKELNLQGIAKDEVITYVSHRYWIGNEDEEFNYLAVATQKGDNYTLYLYETIGGEPNGNPVKIVKGKGKFKSIRYMASNYDFTCQFPIAD